jgi:chemotaxis signal transduction protein
MNEFHTHIMSTSFDLAGGAQASEKYCVFERADTVCAILATSVREVGLRPEISTVPGSHSMLAGLGHIRNEFLPFLRLNVAGGFDPHAGGSEPQMVIVSGDNGPWGLLVDRVIGLLPLDVSLCSEMHAAQGWLAAVMGSATLEHRVVRVLDERALYRLATETMNRYWAHEFVLAGDLTSEPSSGESI